ncbi:MAG: SRPBCC family protein [Pseudomonadota bacterium]
MSDDFNPELDLMIERHLTASRGNVWKAWSKPELMEKWWAPAPWLTKVHRLDLFPGGAFDTEMSGPDGENFRSQGCFLDIHETHRIVFTDALAAGYRPNHQPFMTAEITMTDTPDSGTLYIAHVQHADIEARKKHEEMGFEAGWNSCISQLEEVAKAMGSEQ